MQTDIFSDAALWQYSSVAGGILSSALGECSPINQINLLTSCIGILPSVSFLLREIQLTGSLVSFFIIRTFFDIKKKTWLTRQNDSAPNCCAEDCLLSGAIQIFRETVYGEDSM